MNINEFNHSVCVSVVLGGVVSIVGKQLLDLPRGLQAKLSFFLGESKVLKKICFTASMKSFLWSVAEDLNCWRNLVCRFRASSIVISFSSLFDLALSSFTASEHNPHIHLPPNLSLTRIMYASVHSSTSPQQQHFAVETASTSGTSVSFTTFPTSATSASFITFPSMSNPSLILLYSITNNTLT